MSHQQEMVVTHGDKPPMNWAKLGPMGMLAGLIFMIISWAMIFSNNRDMLISYIYGFVTCTTLALGCLGFLFLHHACRNKWTKPLVRFFEAGSSSTMFMVLLVAFIPILVKAGLVYPWADPVQVAADPKLLHRAPWMNPTMVGIRAVIMFSVWALFSQWMRNSTLRQDRTGEFKKEEDLRAGPAAFGILLFTVTITSGATDWVMSLQPHWYSTMFGGIFLDAAALLALSLGTLLLCLSADRPPFAKYMDDTRLRDCGNMLLAFTMVWGYFNYSQFTIIWHGNLPPLAKYYADRGEGGWNYVGFAMIMGCFFIPFMCLLAPRTKAVPKLLALVAGWIFAFRFLDFYSVVIAMVRKDAAPQPTDLLAILAFAGLFTWAFGNVFAKAAPVYRTGPDDDHVPTVDMAMEGAH